MKRETQIGIQGLHWKTTLLASASSAVLIASILIPKTAHAASYAAANETDLRNAITAANGSTDPDATITLSGNIAMSSGTAFPTSTKAITINTNGFTLSGFDSSGGTTNGGSVTFSGVTIVNAGSIRGGNGSSPVSGNASNGATGLVVTNGSVFNNGSITGGNGGDLVTAVVGTAGAGADMNNTNLVNNGTITGGVSGASPGGIKAGGAGLQFKNGTLTNKGIIQGGANANSTASSNTGLIISQTTNVVNEGTIRAGAGGPAVAISVAGTATITNSGTIEGGTGGAGGVAVNVPSFGTNNLTLINSGTIRGGGSAAAVVFSPAAGATAILELHAGSVIEGNVLASVANVNDVLRLGGDADSSFDVSTIGPTAQYRDFSLFQKTGLSTWTLTGTTSAVTAWNLQGGTLAVSSDGNLGGAAGGLTFNGGTLRNTAAFSTARTMNLNGAGTFQTDADLSLTGTLSGAGALTKTGSAALILNGTNTYTGATNVQGGALVVGDATHTGATLASSTTVNVGSGGTFGGYGSYSGTINNSGTVAAANAIAALAGSGTGSFTVNGTLNNAGTINLGGAGIGNQLVVAGSYVGQNGLIHLNSQLNGDGSPSDKLVLDGGTASGTSRLEITNMGGTGVAITQDGIEVVSAQNGATSATSAFMLASPVRAGIYQYYLAKGINAGTTENWYLRNFVPVVAGDAIPVYRSDAPIYREIAGVSRLLGIEQINTFHERQGYPSLDNETGRSSHAWARVWGSRAQLDLEGTTNPEFHGSIYGVQAGHDLYADSTPDGHRNRYGAFFSFARADGNVEGFVLGKPNTDAGDLSIDAYSLGGYWTHHGPSGWYTDAVLMGSKMTISPKVNDGGGASMRGHAVTGSLEAGLPLTLENGLVLEPQAQLLWQHLTLGSVNAGASKIRLDAGDSYLTRVGLKLSRNADIASTRWQPYLKVSLLRSFGQRDTATFDDTEITNGIEQTAGELRVGAIGKIGKHTSVYAALNYRSSIGGEDQRIMTGNAGLRFTW